LFKERNFAAVRIEGPSRFSAMTVAKQLTMSVLLPGVAFQMELILTAGHNVEFSFL
jgi:hypothetical protein